MKTFLMVNTFVKIWISLFVKICGEELNLLKTPNSIQGLSTIERNGDTSFTYNEDTLALAANIGMGASKAGYSASASFQGTANFVQIRTRYDTKCIQKYEQRSNYVYPIKVNQKIDFFYFIYFWFDTIG